MSKVVIDTFRGQLIHGLMRSAVRGGTLAAIQGTTNEEENHNAVVVGYNSFLLDKYIMALEGWVPPPALEALQAEIGQYTQEK